jgi:enediyne polyketide synthase
MGFGGINTHLVLESASAQRRQSLAARELSLARAYQDAELFLFCSPTREKLAEEIAKLLVRASGISRAELTDLAAARERDLTDGAVRAAIVASRPAELASRLQTLQQWLKGDVGSFKFAEGV